MAKPTVNEPRWLATAPIRNQGAPTESGEVQAYRGHGLFCSCAQRKSGHEFDLLGRDNPRFLKMYGTVLYMYVWVFDLWEFDLELPQGQMTPVREQPHERCMSSADSLPYHSGIRGSPTFVLTKQPG